MDFLLFPTPSNEYLCVMDENAPFEMLSYVLFELSCLCIQSVFILFMKLSD